MKFALLTFLAFVISLAGGVLIVAANDPTDSYGVLPLIKERLPSSLQPIMVLAGATVLPLILIIAAYVSSFRPSAQRRPVFGLYVLGFSFFWIVLACLVAFVISSTTFFEIVPAAIGGVAVLVMATSIRIVEVLIGKVCVGLGDIMLKKEAWRGASSFLGMGRSLLPSNEIVTRKQGLALYEMGEVEQALPILIEAYRRGERDPRLVRTLANSAFQLDMEMASSILAEVLKLEPGNAKYGRRLVELLLRNNQPVEALPVLEKFYDSDDIEDVCLLGRMNAEQGNVERALTLARRAMELEGAPYKRTLADLQVLAMQAPDNPDVLLTLADLNEKIKNREEAISWYLGLLELRPENADARHHLIRRYRELGRLDQA
jgi:tetratricopeptide (TPR) repeat protein